MRADAHSSATRLVFPEKQQVRTESFALEPPKDGEVEVRTVCSLMSTGTENIVYNALFAPGTHWANWAKYPFFPGYAAVGRVERLGAGAEGLSLGQLVVARRGHCSRFVARAADCFAVPSGVEPEQAAWFALAKIASMGAHKIGFELGDSVLVIGAGPIGQMCVRWAFAAGAETIVALDPVERRLALARKGGATATLAIEAADAKSAVADAAGGALPRVVIDTTGNERVFSAALGLARNHGKVLVIGDTGFPAEQRISADVVLRGLTIAGAHDGHETADWNGRRIYRLFFELVKTRRFDLSGLNTHTFGPDQCAQAYALANARRGETMGILFDWRNA